MNNRKSKIWGIVLAVCIITAGGIFLRLQAAAKQMYQHKYDMIVIAHRGGAAYAPENTLGALELAIRNNVQMVEIDVRQLKDGTFIVMHDSNFIRTTGVNMNVWDVEYGDIKDLDAGIYFKNSQVSEKIPTLDEVFECTKGRVALMIDMKVTEQEPEAAMQLMEMVHSFEMKNHCVIGSMNLKFLESIKNIDSEIVTVYIAGNLEQNEYELDYVDCYSIKSRNITPLMVERIHDCQKPIYGWTVNSKEGMRILADKGVDGIVTDNVLLFTP